MNRLRARRVATYLPGIQESTPEERKAAELASYLLQTGQSFKEEATNMKKLEGALRAYGNWLFQSGRGSFGGNFLRMIIPASIAVLVAFLLALLFS
jgi:hypothetical protein